jgi:membrane protease YdiL (CAAX protease family)
MQQLIINSRLFELAKSGTRFPTNRLYAWGVILYAGLVPFAASLCLLPFYIVVDLAQLSAPAQTTMYQNPDTSQLSIDLFLAFLPIFGFVWAWIWLFERRHLPTTGFERPVWAWKYIRGLLLGLTIFSLVMLLQLIFTSSKVDWIQNFSQLSLRGPLIISIGWIIQGAAEEVLTRGFVLPIVGVRWGVLAGILASSAVFTVLHVLNPNLNGIAMLNLLLFGVFTALYGIVEGGLWGICALHSAWNWAQGNLFGLPISGLQTGSSLVKVDLHGPDWWTGGAFGPEGGLATTIVLSLACLAILCWIKRKTMPSSSHSLPQPDHL